MTQHSPETEPTGPTRSLRTAPRWMKWTFAASLCINLIIIGVVVGSVARHHRGGGQELGAMTMRHALRGMGEERRNEAEAFIAANGPAMKAARRANGDARVRLAEIIAAKPFNLAQAEIVFTEMLAAQQVRRGLLHENFVSILSVMSDEERAEAAEQLTKWNRWRKR
jgi:uncharacterized membrane protein